MNIKVWIPPLVAVAIVLVAVNWDKFGKSNYEWCNDHTRTKYPHMDERLKIASINNCTASLNEDRANKSKW